MCSLSSSRSCIVYGQVRMDLNKVWFHVGVCKVGHSLDSNRHRWYKEHSRVALGLLFLCHICIVWTSGSGPGYAPQQAT